MTGSTTPLAVTVEFHRHMGTYYTISPPNSLEEIRLSVGG
jgi:hypothetical protein